MSRYAFSIGIKLDLIVCMRSGSIAEIDDSAGLKPPVSSFEVWVLVIVCAKSGRL